MPGTRISLLAGGAAAVMALCRPTAATAADPPAPAMSMPGMAMPAMTVPTTAAAWAHGAMRFKDLAKVHRPITTASPMAQAHFDQGMALMWGFNHDEATRSFAKAAELDPRCASCFWGVSLTVGPNYNLPFMTGERAQVAFEALGKAQAQAAHATPVEQALIAALAKRYPNAKPLDPTTALPVLTAFAEAMGDVAKRFPDDLDVQTLYAESLMNLHAWKLWTPDGAPAPGTLEIVATLESVLARDSGHPGANHYYVHAVEASPHPEKALAAAGRLAAIAPAEGHLVHMPAHILQRVGDYEGAAEANRRAAVADQQYAAQTTPPDYYGMYSGHNYQFLAYSAAMEGRKAETLAAVDQSRAAMPDSMLLAMPGVDWYIAESYGARVRFGLWDDMLKAPAPDRRLPGLTGGYLYGRGMAQAATGRLAEARATLAELDAFIAALPPDAVAGQNTLKDVLAVAAPMIEARIAQSEGRSGDEIAALRKAVTAEDALAYDEPWNWFIPTRQALGAALLRAGQASEAEAVYRADMRRNPQNGWALYGLAAALRAQGRAADAAKADEAFHKSWGHADVTLAASVF